MGPDIKPCRSKWKGNPTDRECFNQQMHYEPVTALIAPRGDKLSVSI